MVENITAKEPAICEFCLQINAIMSDAEVLLEIEGAAPQKMCMVALDMSKERTYWRSRTEITSQDVSYQYKLNDVSDGVKRKISLDQSSS